MIKATYRLTTPDDATATLSATATIREWKLIADRLKIGNNQNYHGVADDFISVLTELISKAHEQFERSSENPSL